METILINFHQNLGLVKVFNILPLNFRTKKFLKSLQSASKCLLSWWEYVTFFYLSYISQSIQSNLASKNEVTWLTELQIHVQK